MVSKCNVGASVNSMVQDQFFSGTTALHARVYNGPFLVMGGSPLAARGESLSGGLGLQPGTHRPVLLFLCTLSP